MAEGGKGNLLEADAWGQQVKNIGHFHFFCRRIFWNGGFSGALIWESTNANLLICHVIACVISNNGQFTGQVKLELNQQPRLKLYMFKMSADTRSECCLLDDSSCALRESSVTFGLTAAAGTLLVSSLRATLLGPPAVFSVGLPRTGFSEAKDCGRRNSNCRNLRSLCGIQLQHNENPRKRG